tara:strand:+ start:105 stop:323 length:219 start_codon:yes stop_codon:yes gene_type:complete
MVEELLKTVEESPEVNDDDWERASRLYEWLKGAIIRIEKSNLQGIRTREEKDYEIALCRGRFKSELEKMLGV